MAHKETEMLETKWYKLFQAYMRANNPEFKAVYWKHMQALMEKINEA